MVTRPVFQATLELASKSLDDIPYARKAEIARYVQAQLDLLDMTKPVFESVRPEKQGNARGLYEAALRRILENTGITLSDGDQLETLFAILGV